MPNVQGRAGIFIAIDGIDGSGKTTLAQALAALLAEESVVLTREPTSESEWGRRLRDSASTGRLSRDEEIALFHLDRLHHLRTVIGPALAEGRIVISDRYVDSTLAFQAADPAEADTLYERFCPEIRIPDVTFLLDCPLDAALSRREARRQVATTFETAGTLCRAATIYESRQRPDVVHLDAGAPPQAVRDQAVRALASRFPERLGFLAGIAPG